MNNARQVATTRSGLATRPARSQLAATAAATSNTFAATKRGMEAFGP
jgi:hypothetical protein